MKLKKIIKWVVIVGVLGLLVRDAYATGSLRENFNTGDDTAENCRGAQWCSQSYQTAAAYTMNEIHILALRLGSPGTCTVSLRATSAGLPTGADLTSGTFNGNTQSTSATWITVPVTSYDVTTATTYAILLSCPTGSAGNHMAWRMDSANGYASGSYIISTNSGSSWAADTTYDFMFEVYGTDIAGGGSGTSTSTATSTVTTVNIPNLDFFMLAFLFLLTFFGFIFYQRPSSNS